MKKYFYLSIVFLVFIVSCGTEEPIPTYTLSTTVSPVEGGKINASPQTPNYKEGEVVILTPEPNEHWVFKQWEGDGTGSSTPLQLAMNSNKSVVGVFVKREYPLSITIEGEGTVEEKIISNPGGREYPHGTTVELIPKPNSGWVFSNWSGDLTGSETPKRIIIDKEKKINARFIRNQTVTSLNCNSVINNGTLTSGVLVTAGVNSVIPYSGAFGGTYNGQTLASTGVTGLTATLSAGTFAIGSGNLTYTITGTPAAAGTAIFVINIGGQTCTLSRSISPAQPLATIIVDVINPNTGKIWMDRNLGANQAATSSIDAASYGNLYQWGRGNDGHQLRNSLTTTTLSGTDQPVNGSFILSGALPGDWRSPQNANLWQGVAGVNNPCPSGYRIPTRIEWEAELASWGATTAAGAFASVLKLPSAGQRANSNGSISGVGATGLYWSSTPGFNDDSGYFRFDPVSAGFTNTTRASGFSVRCIKN
jgi:uncharacterized protein (TIGR02145 family)